MGLGDIAKQATDTVKALAGDETKTDAALDTAADLAKKATGGKHDDKIDTVRDLADRHLGDKA